MNEQAQANRGGNGSAMGTPSARELVAQGQRVREDVVALAGAVRQVTHGWQALLRDRLERQPYATLAVAAGVGYVLGGGLPTTLLRVMIGVGGRLAVERALTKLAETGSGGS
jgi:hypothetical protein